MPIDVREEPSPERRGLHVADPHGDFLDATLSEVERYARKADRSGLADAAFGHAQRNEA